MIGIPHLDVGRRKMNKAYEDSIAHLEKNGWIRKNAGSYSKGSFEIVFDTSSFIELYDDSQKRIAETRICELSDTIEFLKKNKIGQ